MRSVDEWKSHLRRALLDAQRGRDADAVAVLRETLATIDNAEAPDIALASTAVNGEIDRRVLDAAEATAIVEREVSARRANAAIYASLGRAADGERLERQASVLEAMLR